MNIQQTRWIPAEALQPSQFLISRSRMEALCSAFTLDCLDPVPVIRLDGRDVMTDGHHRAAALIHMGFTSIPVVLDPDELDLEAYQACVSACLTRHVDSAFALINCVVPDEEFASWDLFCDSLHAELAQSRLQPVSSGSPG